jgi:hypothetical protein
MRKAACDPCRDYTNTKFENTALQADFLVPRLLLELKRRKKSIQKKLPKATIINHDNSRIEEIELQLSEYPPVVQFLKFRPAGLLVNEERTGGLEHIQVTSLNFNLPRSYSYKAIETRHKFNHTAFSTTLAKIAYCFAVAEKGIDYFDGSSIRDLLLGRRTDTFNFVGGVLNGEHTSPTYLHHLSFRVRDNWLTVIVHLFASFNAEPYEVVVGKALKK